MKQFKLIRWRWINYKAFIEYGPDLFFIDPHTLFTTIGSYVISIRVVSETLYEGTEDYCINVCE